MLASVEAHNWSFRKLWVLGLFMHVLLFVSVIDLYFKSPVLEGLKPIYGTEKPLAKRAVLFIADGLRAEAIFGTKNRARTPYLTSLREGKSSWGIVHTRVPTESRPGHVAILGGLYEDPSAIMTGWQQNIVQFDSVINQSNYAWSFGSPDIVKIFRKTDEWKLHLDYYNESDEDFSGKISTINLDRFVFEHVSTLLKRPENCSSIYGKIKIKQKQIIAAKNQSEINRKKCKENTCDQPTELACNLTITNCLSKASDHEDKLHEEILNLEELKTNCSTNMKDYCGNICLEKNFFFLHLLGMDTAGHIHKPDSKEYIANLKYIDSGIEETVRLFEEFFTDGETVYLFTSDHGMTNWGSHGDGSEHETEVPFILWGKGVNMQRKRFDIQQADLAPLLSILIGVPIPVNSVGILAPKLLNGTSHQILDAVYQNFAQLSEQYFELRSQFKNDLFFNNYPAFRSHDRYLEEQLERVERFGKTDPENMIIFSQNMINEVTEAIIYLRNYYFYPKVTLMFTGFILWMIYLATLLHGDMYEISPLYYDFMQYKTYFRATILLSALFSVTYLIYICATFMGYIYGLFPICVIIMMLQSKHFINQVLYIYKSKQKFTILWNVGIFILLIEFLVIGFFNKLFCGFVYIIMAFWSKQWQPVGMKFRIHWMILCSGLGLSLLIPTTTAFSYYGLFFGSAFWLVVFPYMVYENIFEYISKMKVKYPYLWLGIAASPIFLCIIAINNSAIVSYNFIAEKGVSEINQAISWILTGLSIILISMSPTGIFVRFLQICGSFIIPVTLMSVHIDLIFYTLLTTVLYVWIQLEGGLQATRAKINLMHYPTTPVTTTTETTYSDFRRTFFYLALMIGYFFAIGNLASFNGFDPLWTKAYLSTFNPILMCSLIIFKMIIPFFIITCAFYTIVVVMNVNTTSVFTILLLYLDVMVLNFMCFIRNEGSWKDIGKSISHFAIMEAMALVTLLSFVLAKYVTTFRFFTCCDNIEEHIIPLTVPDYKKRERGSEFNMGDADITDEEVIDPVPERKLTRRLPFSNQRIGPTSRTVEIKLDPPIIDMFSQQIPQENQASIISLLDWDGSEKTKNSVETITSELNKIDLYSVEPGLELTRKYASTDISIKNLPSLETSQSLTHKLGLNEKHEAVSRTIFLEEDIALEEIQQKDVEITEEKSVKVSEKPKINKNISTEIPEQFEDRRLYHLFHAEAPILVENEEFKQKDYERTLKSQEVIDKTEKTQIKKVLPKIGPNIPPEPKQIILQEELTSPSLIKVFRTIEETSKMGSKIDKELIFHHEVLESGSDSDVQVLKESIISSEIGLLKEHKKGYLKMKQSHIIPSEKMTSALPLDLEFSPIPTICQESVAQEENPHKIYESVDDSFEIKLQAPPNTLQTPMHRRSKSKLKGKSISDSFSDETNEKIHRPQHTVLGGPSTIISVHNKELTEEKQDFSLDEFIDKTGIYRKSQYADIDGATYLLPFEKLSVEEIYESYNLGTDTELKNFRDDQRWHLAETQKEVPFIERIRIVDRSKGAIPKTKLEQEPPKELPPWKPKERNLNLATTMDERTMAIPAILIQSPIYDVIKNQSEQEIKIKVEMKITECIKNDILDHKSVDSEDQAEIGITRSDRKKLFVQVEGKNDEMKKQTVEETEIVLKENIDDWVQQMLWEGFAIALADKAMDKKKKQKLKQDWIIKEWFAKQSQDNNWIEEDWFNSVEIKEQTKESETTKIEIWRTGNETSDVQKLPNGVDPTFYKETKNSKNFPIPEQVSSKVVTPKHKYKKRLLMPVISEVSEKSNDNDEQLLVKSNNLLCQIGSFH